jgi:choline dehydrogenase-like flavoprotein
MGGRVITKMVQFSPTRFGQVYRDEIARADNISSYVNANVMEIETTKDARTVTRLRVACLQGNRFWVSARLFILATGGIENACLLLLSNKVQSGGLGNQNDLVGRFFMDHAGLAKFFYQIAKFRQLYIYIVCVGFTKIRLLRHGSSGASWKN